MKHAFLIMAHTNYPLVARLLKKLDHENNNIYLHILVIEGIHGLNDKLSYALPKESKFKIYISALTQLNVDEHNRIPTTDGRLIRRMVRDARTRGIGAKETIARWQSVRNGEESYIFPFQEYAHSPKTETVHPIPCGCGRFPSDAP